jgi:hypothetical protein
VTGEVVIDVPSLSLPESDELSGDSLLRSDAVALFVDRASAVQPGFAITSANAAAILRVCRHVDGIPLALELAAVRLNALGLEALDRGLSARLGALGTGDRSAAPRQQTLEAAIDWSYQLLSEDERLLWARLSVFAGGFEIDAARAVCAGDGLTVEAIPELIGTLVEKSVCGDGMTNGPTGSASSNHSGSSARSGSAMRCRDDPPDAPSGLDHRAREHRRCQRCATGRGLRAGPDRTRQRLERPRLLPVRSGRGRVRSRDLPGPLAVLGIAGSSHGGPRPVRRLARAAPGTQPGARPAPLDLVLRCGLTGRSLGGAAIGDRSARDRPADRRPRGGRLGAPVPWRGGLPHEPMG